MGFKHLGYFSTRKVYAKETSITGRRKTPNALITPNVLMPAMVKFQGVSVIFPANYTMMMCVFTLTP
jgi:hypothetical protein